MDQLASPIILALLVAVLTVVSFLLGFLCAYLRRQRGSSDDDYVDNVDVSMDVPILE